MRPHWAPGALFCQSTGGPDFLSGTGASLGSCVEPLHGSRLGALRPVWRLAMSRQQRLRLVAENYPAIALGLLGPLLDLLSSSREACGGDIDKFLIMLVVAVRTTAHKDFAGYSQAQLLSGEVPVFPSLGVNIQSIADSVRAPKETVRRKVSELVEAGWIERRGHELYFTARAYRDLAAVRERLEIMAVRHAEIVEGLVDAAAVRSA
jgi:hypothetical protein